MVRVCSSSKLLNIIPYERQQATRVKLLPPAPPTSPTYARSNRPGGARHEWWFVWPPWLETEAGCDLVKQTSEKCLLRIVVFPQMVGGCLVLNPNTSPLGDVWHVKSLNQFVQSLLSWIAKSRVHFQNAKVSNEPWERWSISLPQGVLIVDLCFHRRSVGHILGVFLDAVDWMFLGYQWRKPINQPRVLTLLCSHWQHSHTKACISTEETTARPRSSRATSNSTTWPWPRWIATVHPLKVIRSTYIPPCKIC